MSLVPGRRVQLRDVWGARQRVHVHLLPGGEGSVTAHVECPWCGYTDSHAGGCPGLRLTMAVQGQGNAHGLAPYTTALWAFPLKPLEHPCEWCTGHPKHHGWCPELAPAGFWA